MDFWGVDCVVGVGRYLDGKIGEVFINTQKIGTSSDVLVRDAAVILSIAMQYGAPLEVMSRAITRNPDGQPSGPIGELLDKLASEEAQLARAVGDLA